MNTPASAASVPTDLIGVPEYALLRAGDEAAWFRLISEYEGRIYGYLYRLEGNPENALDLTQEVFYRAWRSFGTFQPEQRLLPWLYAVARHTQIESHRRKQHARFSIEEAHQDTGFEVPSEVHSPALAAESAQAQSRVQAALMTLPPEFREAVVLRFMEDLSYEEIAQLQGVALGTAKSRVYRAKEQLAALLHSEELPSGDCSGKKQIAESR